MADERVYENYPVGFSNWNERFFDLFIEGVSRFPPEMILGALESVKILYMNRGIEVTQNTTKEKMDEMIEEPIEETIEEPTEEPTEEDIKFNEQDIIDEVQEHIEGEENEQTGEDEAQ